MMLRLYKFTCEPNYPVCEGELIFAVKDYKDMVSMMAQARMIADREGFNNWNSLEAKLEFLGTFMPSTEHPEIPYIISCQTGEY